MPLDPQAQAVLDQLAALNLPPNYTVTPSEARANARLRPSVPGPEVSPRTPCERPVRLAGAIGG